MAFIAIAGPSELSPAGKADVVVNAIEAYDNWIDEIGKLALNRDLLLAQCDQLIAERQAGSATTTVDPKPQSSVTLTQGAKGDTRAEVKVYDSNPDVALAKAMEIYGKAVSATVGEP